MKNLVFAVVAAVSVLFLSGCVSGNRYVIEGTGESLVDGHWMYVMDGEDWSILDSARIENGSFRIEGSDFGSQTAFLYMGANSAPSGLYQVSDIVFLEPGNVSMEYMQDYDMFLAHGTPMNDLYSRLIIEGIEDYDDPLDLVRNNRNVLGLVLMDGFLVMPSKSETEELLDGFPESMKEHPLYVRLRETVEAIKADVGLPYCDVEGKDTDGNVLRLSGIVSRKGVRYVLLDFWASWCAPCREELPELVSIYGQYHRSGFEIYGISFDGNQQSWKDAIREFRMSWPNALAEFSGNASTSPFWTAYGVSGIPSNFLIDASTGEVIAKNLHGEDLAAELETLFPAEASFQTEAGQQ